MDEGAIEKEEDAITVRNANGNRKSIMREREREKASYGE